mmetsp:Transcript_4682/g.14846  ORF Transcript_4682/g.14846 Transcript_4682/m.14846 type:complete len:246 (+) Transcript_4682:463-1200(+)
MYRTASCRRSWCRQRRTRRFRRSRRGWTSLQRRRRPPCPTPGTAAAWPSSTRAGRRCASSGPRGPCSRRGRSRTLSTGRWWRPLRAVRRAVRPSVRQRCGARGLASWFAGAWRCLATSGSTRKKMVSWLISSSDGSGATPTPRLWAPSRPPLRARIPRARTVQRAAVAMQRRRRPSTKAATTPIWPTRTTTPESQTSRRSLRAYGPACRRTTSCRGTSQSYSTTTCSGSTRTSSPRSSSSTSSCT